MACRDFKSRPEIFGGCHRISWSTVTEKPLWVRPNQSNAPDAATIHVRLYGAADCGSTSMLRATKTITFAFDSHMEGIGTARWALICVAT